MARRKKNEGSETVPAGVTEDRDQVVAEGAEPTGDAEVGEAAGMPEPRKRISGDELKTQLRQERREKRLKEKGY